MSLPDRAVRSRKDAVHRHAHAPSELTLESNHQRPKQLFWVHFSPGFAPIDVLDCGQLEIVSTKEVRIRPVRVGLRSRPRQPLAVLIVHWDNSSKLS